MNNKRLVITKKHLLVIKKIVFKKISSEQFTKQLFIVLYVHYLVNLNVIETEKALLHSISLTPV